MKTKEKTKKIKITLKGILAFLAFIISVLYSIVFYNFYFRKNVVYAKETVGEVENIAISKAEEIDIEKVIDQNAKEGYREEYSVEETVLEYLTKYRNNASLPKGMIQVVQEGREGKQEITIKKTYQEQELMAEEQISSKITKASVNKIVEIGTGNYAMNDQVKVGDIVIVTSDRLSVMLEPNEKAQKMTTLTKGDNLKVLAIQKEWYRIAYGNTNGYVKVENTIHKDAMNSSDHSSNGSNTTTKSKAELTSHLSFDMALNKPSGLTLEQFKKVLADAKDTNKIFENNAEYFYYIEKQYHINGIFVAAVGIHESAWGTSQIACNKNNLFGYGAYDANPYQGAYQFSGYSESIDLMARVFVKYYLNAKGNTIYGGEKAAGTYYNGATLRGVNTKYATDKNWANGVYQHMKYLYNKL